MKKILLFTALVILTACATVHEPKQVNAPLKGKVSFLFDLKPDGYAENIIIIESVPHGYFDEEALEAIKKWKFKPRMIDGSAVYAKNMRYTLEFDLAE